MLKRSMADTMAQHWEREDEAWEAEGAEPAGA